MPRVGKKARITGIESLKGKDPISAAKVAELSQPESSYRRIGDREPAHKMLSFADASKRKQVQHVLNYWSEWLAMEVEGVLTWKDRIKVSELIAKHIGMLSTEGTTTVNMAFFDAKNASASDLMAKLEELKASKSLEQANAEAIDVAPSDLVTEHPQSPELAL